MVTKTVTVRHTGALLPAAAVAALNEARLDASLQAPRQQISTAGSWRPPWRGEDSAPNLSRAFCHTHWHAIKSLPASLRVKPSRGGGSCILLAENVTQGMRSFSSVA